MARCIKCGVDELDGHASSCPFERRRLRRNEAAAGRRARKKNEVADWKAIAAAAEAELERAVAYNTHQQKVIKEMGEQLKGLLFKDDAKNKDERVSICALCGEQDPDLCYFDENNNNLEICVVCGPRPGDTGKLIRYIRRLQRENFEMTKLVKHHQASSEAALKIQMRDKELLESTKAQLKRTQDERDELKAQLADAKIYVEGLEAECYETRAVNAKRITEAAEARIILHSVLPVEVQVELCEAAMAVKAKLLEVEAERNEASAKAADMRKQRDDARWARNAASGTVPIEQARELIEQERARADEAERRVQAVQIVAADRLEDAQRHERERDEARTMVERVRESRDHLAAKWVKMGFVLEEYQRPDRYMGTPDQVKTAVEAVGQMATEHALLSSPVELVRVTVREDGDLHVHITTFHKGGEIVTKARTLPRLLNLKSGGEFLLVPVKP